MSAGKTIATVIPTEISDVLDAYSVKSRLTKSHIIREIVIGKLSLEQIKEALNSE